MLTSLALISMVSCDKDKDNGGNTDNSGGNTNTPGGGTDNPGGNTNTPGGDTNTPGGEEDSTDYTVTVKTEGGMALAEISWYVYTYKDDTIDELVNYGTTDANGKAGFKLTGNVTDYAVKVDIDLPEGCIAEPFYRLAGTNLDITVQTGLVTGSSLAGKYFQAGDYMYDFTVIDAFGKQVKLSEELKKSKVVILNFWYINCSACQLEFPFMKEVHSSDKYIDDVSIIALNPYDDDLSIRAYAQEMGFEFEVAKDTVGLSSAFNVTGYPTSVVIDRYGMISLVEVGALPSKRAFEILFDYYTADDYAQAVVKDLQSITPVEKPDIPMPDSDDIKAAFGDVGSDFYMDPNEEMAWPFIITEFDNQTCLKASNSGKDGSFAMIYADITLEAGEAVAFDYFASCEEFNDVLYVMVDGKDIYRISGVGTEWETCYAYVAKEAGTYQIALCYLKDTDITMGDDNVYIKNLRKISSENVTRPTYIYRYASTNPDSFGDYQNYVEVYVGADGYYHVGSETGPLLLADLMGKTHFSEDNNIYTLSQVIDITLEGMNETVAKKLERYSSYASNSQLYGLCPVTPELKLLLDAVCEDAYVGTPTENTWLEICCYYDAYGTEEHLADPIKGLATFSAYETILSEINEPGYPNHVTYDRVIMPRGLLFAFTPTKSGVYQVTSNSLVNGEPVEVNGWFFKEQNIIDRTEWIVYDNVDRLNSDYANIYMMAYLEAGVTYYIDVAYYDVYQYGTIDFRVDYLGAEGYYRFSLASPGYFTYYESETSDAINKIVAGGIDVVLGSDGIYREKRTDGRDGSILYADFTQWTPIFSSQSLLEVIDNNGFDFSVTEDDLYVLSLMNSTAAMNYYLDLYLKALWADDYEAKYDEYKVDEVLRGKYHGEEVNGSAVPNEKDTEILGYYEAVKTDDTYNNDENFVEFLEYYWATEYFDEYYELYNVADVLEGIYHGKGEDLTEAARYIAESYIIKAGFNELLKTTIEADDERIGTVIVTEEVAELLQKLMDKYTFAGVENSWTKLCYYHEYFSTETPGKH